MKPTLIATAALLSTACLALPPASAENVEHTRQLLATKQCPNCDLSGAGLVLTNLAGANLAGANLSRANLTGANLTGANLSAASLFGANLIGAKLGGADLSVADLRDAYLNNADLVGANLNGTHFQGAIAIPTQIAKAEDFYNWGMAQGKKGDAAGAIDYFNQALNVQPDYAAAYMARSAARYQNLDRKGAIIDAQQAAQLYLAQGNMVEHQTALAFVQELQTPPNTSQPKSKGNFLNFLGALGSAALQLFLF